MYFCAAISAEPSSANVTARVEDVWPYTPFTLYVLTDVPVTLNVIVYVLISGEPSTRSAEKNFSLLTGSSGTRIPLGRRAGRTMPIFPSENPVTGLRSSGLGSEFCTEGSSGGSCLKLSADVRVRASSTVWISDPVSDSVSCGAFTPLSSMTGRGGDSGNSGSWIWGPEIPARVTKAAAKVAAAVMSLILAFMTIG